MSILRRTIFAIAATTGLSASPILAETTPENKSPTRTFTADGSARCGYGGSETSGKMPTSFANQYWSNMACGASDRAQAILDSAPKSTPERGIPSLLDKTSALAECFRESFPYSVESHNLEVISSKIVGNRWENELIVRHGFYGIRTDTFHQIQRAVTAACDKMLGIKFEVKYELK
jgi:hypothetical protein